MSYKTVHTPPTVHKCILPDVYSHSPETIIECDFCGRNYILKRYYSNSYSLPTSRRKWVECSLVDGKRKDYTWRQRRNLKKVCSGEIIYQGDLSG